MCVCVCVFLFFVCLQQIEVFPGCKSKKQFQPHLTVAQFNKNEIKTQMHSLQKNWKPIVFQCDHICMIARNDKHPSFQIKHTINF